MSSKQRDRGRILTPDGLSRLQQAIRGWEGEHEVRCTQERIKELTSAVKEGGLDPGTIRKILKAKDGVDPESIRCLFTTFALELTEIDLVPSARLQIQTDPNFVGREGAIADLTALVNRGVKVIVIQARGGVGKTTLARKYLQQEFGSFLEFPIAKETKDIASIESLIEEKLRQLGEEPGREFFVSLDRLKRKLQNERIGILIDNLEPALDSAGKFIEPHRRYVELLRVLADPSVQSITLITTRERLRESSVTVENYILRSLDLTAWEQFFQSRNLSTDMLDFAALHNAYGGNAKAMDIIRSAILEDYAGDITAYWQANQHDLFIERDLEDLVTQQFDRLQQIDLDAYNLLCRMGCYRYQDVPTVPIEGLLCLLWDVPENRQRRVVKSLQDRSLVEFKDGEYWLHPVIRSEAIPRLRENKDWEVGNRKAADFWAKKIETIEVLSDALQALEAYYHYMEIQDWEGATTIILQGRYDRWQERTSNLGYSCYRLGIINQTILIINSIIPNIKEGFHAAHLHLLLGDLYVLAGRISLAMQLNKNAICMILRTLNIESVEHFNMIELPKLSLSEKSIFIHCFFNKAFMELCAWDLEESKSTFELMQRIFDEKIILSKEQGGLYRYQVGTWYYLALLNLYLGCQGKAVVYAEKASKELPWVAAGAWRRGYAPIVLGEVYSQLGDIDKAFDMYNEANLYARESQNLIIRVKSLVGYAKLFALQGDFSFALKHNFEALTLLKEIDAVYPQAETYYQLGLSYKNIGEIEKSNESFQEAIRLFTGMEAPKQVERVMRSMNNPEQLD